MTYADLACFSGRNFRLLIAAWTNWRIEGVSSGADKKTVLVTGACGQIGRAVSSILRDAGHQISGVDVDSDTTGDVVVCDLRSKEELSRLFHAQPNSSRYPSCW